MACRSFQDPFCLQHCGVYLQITDVCFWRLFRRTYECCLPEADPAQQSNIQLLSEWSVTSDPPTQTPSPRCEKDKHCLQNMSHQRRRYFRIYLGVFNATKRSRENHLWRKCWDWRSQENTDIPAFCLFFCFSPLQLSQRLKLSSCVTFVKVTFTVSARWSLCWLDVSIM